MRREWTKHTLHSMSVQENSAHPGGPVDNSGTGHKSRPQVALLTGGSDKPYVFGLTTCLLSMGAVVDLIGSDELDCPEYHGKPRLTFFNLRGSQREDASFFSKVARISLYYARLIRYALTAKPKIFHILWNNKFEHFDRTALMLFYRALGKRIAFTAHNVNAAKRDGNDSRLNRFTLRVQYGLAHHIFVHTEKMKHELLGEFRVRPDRVTVIPFGINNAVPNTSLTPSAAKERLGIRNDEKAILFFGRITPYKGLEYLIAAFRAIAAQGDNYRLIIAGRPDNCESYWRPIEQNLGEDVRAGRILLKAEYIPDEETEVYFKAADVLVLPYKEIYQSGVLFLGHSFGLPVLAADVGSLQDDIVEGETGFVFKPADAPELAKVLERYFASELYLDLGDRRHEIQDFANRRHSWDVVGRSTLDVYDRFLRLTTVPRGGSDLSSSSLDAKIESAGANQHRTSSGLATQKPADNDLSLG